MWRTKRRGVGFDQMLDKYLYETLGLYNVAVTLSRPAESEGLRIRRKDAGNLHVRFDEREQETEPRQAGLRRRNESFVTRSPERLTPLRLFSTLAIF